ncbi:VCBS repeat-containing protein [Bacillus sp. FJAT-49711]|uniref:DL-endopeptidase inhibitor IseA family protein n=1 Tax=Bacillus sp. FJAT-49711 TaxID=2833585 RepID=UPI001BC95FF7|nr:DL-endopeptidase inhibitor IseA family protein [Bacillus sp. FJAT-49711]MBS4219767.1 VCBS repeat-containing protein [Bacillus sp. FJAT-49711]
MRSFLFVLSACLLLSGCNMLPEPGSLIQAPKLASAISIENESIQAIAKKYLPKGTTLITANSPISTDSVLYADLDGDGQEEAIVFYQSKNRAENVGMFILEKQKDKWEKMFAKKGLGYDVNWASASDFDGDGKQDLLVGWKIGSAAGNVLEVFTWNEDGFKQLTKVNYHTFESIEIQGDQKTRLAVWKKDVNDIYDIQLLKWENGALIADEEHYPTYFPKVVDYYKSRIERVPDASYYWYYLADAQLKSNHPEQALNSIEKGMMLKTIVPSFNQFTDLKKKIEKSLKEYGNSNFQYEIRDADVTLEIPKEVASHITIEEGNASMDGYAVSVYISSEKKKDLLFAIYIHSKNMNIPEPDRSLEKIAENEQYIYFAKKNKEKINLTGLDPEVKDIYEQSIAQVDKMIANVRPGLVYPSYVSLEESGVIKMVTEAANKYWYVTSGGKISGAIDSFTNEGLDYRYMGSDLDTREKLNAFLGESYTSSVIQSYINRANIINHNGKLAQPNADGGSIVNHEKAIVIGMRDNGNEKEIDLKAPLGTSYYYEYVHVVFSKTKDGWRISSDIGTF